MKRRLLRLFVGVAVMLVLLTVPINTSASGAELTELDIARQAGQTWLDITAPHVPDLPKWTGACVVSPQAYYSLNGNLNAFQFSIMNGTSIVGNVLVGTSSYEFRVLRASEVEPPSIPTLEELRKALEELGIEAEPADSREPIQLVYTGVDGQYALYKIAGKTIAVNLFTKKAILASGLKPTIAREEISTNLISRGSSCGTRDTGYHYLTMTAYQYGYCGPASGVSIARYYRDEEGYSSLWSDSSLYNSFYYDMDTYVWGGATLPGCYGTGFEETTENCGYDNFDYANDWWVTMNDYWTIVSDIDSGHPTALMLTGEWHWRAIKGYDYVTAPYNWYYVICTNSQTGASFEYLDWYDDVVSDYYAFKTCISD